MSSCDTAKVTTQQHDHHNGDSIRTPRSTKSRACGKVSYLYLTFTTYFLALKALYDYTSGKVDLDLDFNDGMTLQRGFDYTAVLIVGLGLLLITHGLYNTTKMILSSLANMFIVYWPLMVEWWRDLVKRGFAHLIVAISWIFHLFVIVGDIVLFFVCSILEIEGTIEEKAKKE